MKLIHIADTHSDITAFFLGMFIRFQLIYQNKEKENFLEKFSDLDKEKNSSVFLESVWTVRSKPREKFIRVPQ